ncbi:MAG: LacI family DNA-binding transcriptional regulator, partial [Victivallales bacterium]|nr:LacI family DNA-binding transcriptional regulator [Victivallales bacterium]
ENTTEEKICRRIGIITGRITGSPFQAFLNIYLESALSRRGCRAVWFHQRECAVEKLYNSVDDIINLRYSVEANEIDGVISLIYCDAELEAYLKQSGLSLVYVSNYMPLANHICLDYSRIMEQSVSLLHKRGFRQIELLMTAPLDWMERLFAAALAKCGISKTSSSVHCRPFGQTGTRAYQQWLEGIFLTWYNLPSSQRPDALLVPDDMVALYLHFFLLKHSDWQPAIIPMVNINTCLPAPEYPLGYWQFDVSAYADFIVEKLIEMQKRNELTLPFTLFTPTFFPPDGN